jgi:PhnB protein
MPVKFIPGGFHSLTPCVKVKTPEKFIQFLKLAFNANADAGELRNVKKEDETFGTFEIFIGNSIIMIFPAKEGQAATSVSLYFYVENADKVYNSAIAAGAISLMEPADMHYGDRCAGVKDPWNNEWWIATHIEDISLEELKRREDQRDRERAKSLNL